MQNKTASKTCRHLINILFAGNAGQCADYLGIKRPQMSRWVTENEAARQGISEESARAIESKLGHPCGWMDGDQAAPQPTEMNRTEIRNSLRRDNFAKIRSERFKTSVALVNKLGEGFSPSFVSQLLNGHRGIGDEIADKIEKRLGLLAGYLDRGPFTLSRHAEKDASTQLQFIGERVQLRRKELGISQTELARRVGIASSSISELENGKSKSSVHLATMADVLGVSALWLETGVDPLSTDERLKLANALAAESTANASKIHDDVLRLAEKLLLVPEEKLKAVSILLGIKL